MNKLNTNIFADLQDYMFTSKNINRYTKHIIHFHNKINDEIIIPKSTLHHIKTNKSNETKVVSNVEARIERKNYDKKKETMYRPKQKDSLFWCFYILKNGFSNYEMNINNQYFVVEKNEKFKYIDLIRKNKDLMKLHKIKPLTQLEDDLANKDRISFKTFFALCAIENINVLLVDKRKVYELLCTDIDKIHPINVVHNNEKYGYSIELDVTDETITKYAETYYKMTNFDSTLKSITSYKLEELLDLCKKLNINIEEKKNNEEKTTKSKMSKKDIYELLVMNY